MASEIRPAVDVGGASRRSIWTLMVSHPLWVLWSIVALLFVGVWAFLIL